MIEEGKNFSDIDFDVLDDILQKLGFFERFTKSTRINLYKLATYSEIPPGEYVFMQGDYGDNLFIILKGSVTVKADKKFEHELNVK